MNRHADPKQTNIGTQIRFGIYPLLCKGNGMTLNNFMVFCFSFIGLWLETNYYMYQQ